MQHDYKKEAIERILQEDFVDPTKTVQALLDLIEEYEGDSYNDGKTDGYDEGVSDGRNEGYDDGYGSGCDAGREEGFSAGYDDGFEAGVREAE